MRICLFRILSVIIVLFFTAGSVSASESEVDVTKIERIPDYSVELSAEDFEEYSDIYTEQPLNDKFLAYQVRLPKGWSRVEIGLNSVNRKSDENENRFETDDGTGIPQKISRRFLGEIAKYYGPGRIEELSRFEIKAQELDYEITAKNWFMHEVLLQGYTLEGLKVISDRRVEALYVVVEKDTAFIVRSAVEMNGPRIVVSSYYVPEIHWMKERAYQQRAIESFNFVAPESVKIEKMREHMFLDLLSFEYPASWKLVAPSIFSTESMEAKLLRSKDNKILNGEIHINIVSSEFTNAVADEIQYIKDSMESRGLTLGKLLGTREDYHLNEDVYYAHVEQYEATNQSGYLGYELWIAIMEEERYYYVLTLLTPSRRGDFYMWAQNEETFRRVIQSFKP